MRGLAFWLSCLVLVGCGSAAKNGTGGGGDDGVIFDPCVANPKPGYDPAARGLDACCDDGPAHCVPSDQVLPALASALGTCSDGTSVCMPDPIIEAGGGYQPPPCTSSVGNAAGVCLSKCISLVANNSQSAVLGQDGCGDGELCVPCINPFDGTSTGACSINEKLCSGDDGGVGDGGAAMCPYTGPPLLDPSSFDDCAPACGGAHCLPAASVPAAQQGLLDKCPAKGGAPGLCAPDKLIETGGNFVPKTCASVAGAEGRCLSTCIPQVAAQAAQLPQDVCPGGTKCAPCFNPTAADPTAPTGACGLGCDKPTKPPVVLMCPWTGPPVVDPASFPGCAPACGGAHCVPAADVPAAEQKLLATCPGGFCAPDPIIATAGNYVPPTCSAFNGTPAEGRCTSVCIPSVAQQANQLHQHTCAGGELCAPCYDPFSGDDTGACRTGCDQPAQPKYTFPSCCSTQGTCVPTENIPSDQLGNLEQDVCPSTALRCVPDEMLPGGPGPRACTGLLGGEGRCYADCLNLGLGQVFPQRDCPNNHTCVPCWAKSCN
jgi:hypothetical protein